uniref:Uncharacterized protein n=1 Tax=Cacopsylla melanoneura TaxID=428564 RepID=A0A8D8ZN67_9HEMI
MSSVCFSPGLLSPLTFHIYSNWFLEPNGRREKKKINKKPDLVPEKSPSSHNPHQTTSPGADFAAVIKLEASGARQNTDGFDKIRYTWYMLIRYVYLILKKN